MTWGQGEWQKRSQEEEVPGDRRTRGGYKEEEEGVGQTQVQPFRREQDVRRHQEQKGRLALAC